MPSVDTTLLLLISLGLACLIILLRKGLPAYIAEKGKNFATREDIEEIARNSERGKNLATREDIEEITRKIESVKGEISRVNSVEELKRKLKYEACLEALTVIDAYFSHLFVDLHPTPQPVSTVRAREVHSKLMLSCNNVLIIEKFAEIYFGPPTGKLRPPFTDSLNEFRNLIRLELGFGSPLPFDKDRAWIGRAIGDPQTPLIPNALAHHSTGPK
jgi:hypothetical protein